MSNSNPITVLITPAQATHADGIEQLQADTYQFNPQDWPDMITAQKAHKHLEIFPEGQFVAVDMSSDKVVGMTVCMRIDFELSAPFLEPWVKTTNDGWLTPHKPKGAWMYGVESCVHPDYQGRGIGSKLMDARFDVLKQLNLRGMVAGSAIINYYQASHLTVEEYVQQVVASKQFDTNLTKQLRKGFQVHNIIPNFMDDDEGNLGWGVAIVWHNTSYTAEGDSSERVVSAPKHEIKLDFAPK